MGEKGTSKAERGRRREARPSEGGGEKQGQAREVERKRRLSKGGGGKRR
jgi:hypothetical protein